MTGMHEGEREVPDASAALSPDSIGQSEAFAPAPGCADVPQIDSADDAVGQGALMASSDASSGRAEPSWPIRWGPRRCRRSRVRIAIPALTNPVEGPASPVELESSARGSAAGALADPTTEN
jgi:hypothetical protein